MNKLGRPLKYTDNTTVLLRPRGDSTLKVFSDRRAIVNYLVDCGGKTTIGAINEHFGFDFSHKVQALVRSGWLEVIE